MRPEVVAEFRAATEYYHKERHLSRSFRAQSAKLLALLGQGSGVVLDIGAGPALLGPAIVSLGYDYIAMDMVLEMLRGASGILLEHRAAMVVADAEALPFADRSFAAVTAMGVLEYMSNLSQALVEINRVLAPGGVAIVTVPHGSAPYRRSCYAWRRLKAAAKRLLLRREGEPSASVSGTMKYVPTPRRWREEAAKAGFDVAADGFCNCQVLPEPLASLSPGFAQRLGAVMEPACLVRPMRALGTQYVMKLVRA